MCPVGPAFRTTSRTAFSTASGGANNTAGSTLPCTDLLPTRRRPSSMSMVQSSPMQSTPVVAMRSSRPPLPLAYSVRGTPGCVDRTLSTTMLMYGLDHSSHMCGGSCPPQLSKICTHCAPASIWNPTYSPMASATASRMALSTSGCVMVMDLMVLYVELDPPSTMYVARVQGDPTKPSTAALSPTSWRRILSDSPTKGSMPRSSLCIIFSPSASRMGFSSTGPL
mmetsp:Transcript_35046/g.85904  ORF Transcript_35046/g.85904 Transcript_35046/m.85904 type:complete len:224 (+) Transcript_35046:477-1148(+)